jgi:bifunctional ADP-heptose synthase (sugar kinase/adenylyltransferase)
MKEQMMSQQQKLFKILLLGDSCYDYYHYGEVKRISPEAPIPIFDHLYTTKKLGMMSNVLENFRALGIDPDYQTYFSENKNRYIDIKSKQQLLRVDQKTNENGINHVIHEIIDYKKYDAIVISDYDKGFLNYEDLYYITKSFSGPIYIDTKKTDLQKFKYVIFKINEHEYNKLTTYPENMIVTAGEKGVFWKRPKPDEDLSFSVPKVEIHDVCGAGDTFLSALVFEHLRTNDMEKAIKFAMKAAAITVQKIGVYAPTLEEIENDNKT